MVIHNIEKQQPETNQPTLSLPAVSHAKTFQSQENKPVSTVKGAVYGQSSPELLATFDPATSSLKMLLPCSPEGMMLNTQLTDAYVAGLIDGEGCIGITHNKKTNTFATRIDVGMTIKAVPIFVLLEKQYGGKTRKTRDATAKWEEAHAWMVQGQESRNILERILPHLVLKKEQAQMVLGLLQMMDSLPKHKNGTTKWTPDARKDAAVMKSLIQEMNLKGPSVTQEAGWFARHVGGKLLTPQRDMFTSHGMQEFCGTWPKSGVMRSNGTVYALESLTDYQPVRPTDESESGLSAGMWPTPNQRDYKDSLGAKPNKQTHVLDAVRGKIASEVSGQLNPAWVCWLMGLPLDYLDLDGWKNPESEGLPPEYLTGSTS